VTEFCNWKSNYDATRGKCGSLIKAGFLYFSPNFSTQINVS